MTTAPKDVPIEIQATIRDAYRKLMAQGLKRRAGQQKMIAEISWTVANSKRVGEAGSADRLLAVQAPTGSGKSFAYGLGSIPVALAAGLKVIISSATVQLQEQIVEKDLKALKAVLPDISAVLVKGRSRYACPVRMNEAARGEGAGRDDNVRAMAIKLTGDLKAKVWSGDVDDLADQPSSLVFSAFSNDRNGCAGRRCSLYDNCPYYAARSKIEHGNVLITNHALLMSDIAGGNNILPKIEGCVLVLDEAHEIPEQALSALEGCIALEESSRSMMRAGSLMATVRGQTKGFDEECLNAYEAFQRLGGCLSEARMAVSSTGTTTNVRDPKKAVRFPMGKLPEWMAQSSHDCKLACNEARCDLETLIERLAGEDGESVSTKKREQILSELGKVAGKLDKLIQVWGLMATDLLDGAPVAKWLEVDEEHHDVRVCASPVGVGGYLHDKIWSQCAASVHLSATLTTVGGFKNYLDESGLGRTQGVRTLEVESPFNYELQASLTVPKGMVNPKDTQGHTQDLAARVEGMLLAQDLGTGALVIFASWKQLNEVHAAMPDSIQERLLVQGAGMSKRQILDQHKKRVENGQRSCIFGCSSFESGIDLRGDLLTLVVISKIPFGVPSNPIVEAQREYIESQGLSYFDEVVVPQACRRLAQSTGRLIRSEEDVGRIVIADPRLTRTAYGRAMLKSLPGYRLDEDWMPEISCVAANSPSANEWFGIQPPPW
jgi:ATP-dependent DNA helicase DinG